MNRRAFIGAAGAFAVGLGLGDGGLAAAAGVALPKPSGMGAKTLEEALRERKSTREYADTELPADVLSGLLWAAWGINRSDGRRTAPSARNRQVMEIYVVKKDGWYLYDAPAHALTRKGAEDIRALTGKQAFVATAPVNLVYVADLERAGGAGKEEQMFLAAADTGHISQNVYLYCASFGLGAVLRANIDLPGLSNAMRLKDSQRVVMAQSVGYPKA